MPYCNRCGTEYELGRDQCPKCGADLPRLAEHPDGPANAHLTLSTPTARRVLAGAIDMAVAYALLVYVLVLLSRRLPIVRGPLLLGAMTLIVLLFPNPYLLLKDALGGKSVGKLIAGLIVYNEHERRASGMFDSVIRNWYLAIPLVGPTVLALVIGAQVLGGKSSRLGDGPAYTRVITDLDYQRLR